MHHSHRLPEAAALGELDVDPIDCSGELGNIGRDEARLVSKNGQLGSFADEAQPLDIVPGDGLLEHLDTLLDEELAHADRVLRSPRGVRIDAQALIRSGVANDANDFHIAVGSQLDLENGVVARFANSLLQLMVFRDRDSEARLRSGLRIEAPYPVDRKTKTLSKQIVERGADRALRRSITAQSAVQLTFDGLERHWISPLEQRLELSERRDHGCDRFSVIAVGRRLTESLHSIIVGDSDNHVSMVRVPASRYDERVRWL